MVCEQSIKTFDIKLKVVLTFEVVDIPQQLFAMINLYNKCKH
jgi:hypothetical protein